MKENKFLRLVKTLNQQELKAFHKYLNGLYGKQEKMIQLFDYFFLELKKKKAVTLPATDTIQNKIFAKTQSVKVVGNLFADLYKYLEEFLRWQKINAKADNYIKDKLQIEIYKERRLDEWFYTKIEKTTKKIEAAPKDMNNYLRLFELNYTTYFKFSTEKYNQGIVQLLSEGLLKLDKFFLAAKLKYACAFKTEFNVNKSAVIEDWVADFLQEQNMYIIEQEHFLKTYFLAVQLFESQKANQYFILKEMFMSNRPSFSKEDQLIILTVLLNFITKKLRAGDLEYKKEAFELYKIGVEEKISIINNEIGAVPFFNIINVACSMKEIEWAEQFLKNYAIYLNDKDKQEIKKLAKGIICFEKKEYDEVLVLLRDIRFKYIYYETRARALIIRSLVEQAVDKSIIQAECDAFSQSLRRNGLLAANLLMAYKNFVRLTRMIFINTKTTKKQLEDFLVTEKFFVYKRWLQEKVADYKGYS